ncbi:unnamed protein product [Merluccius merluccius]
MLHFIGATKIQVMVRKDIGYIKKLRGDTLLPFRRQRMHIWHDKCKGRYFSDDSQKVFGKSDCHFHIAQVWDRLPSCTLNFKKGIKRLDGMINQILVVK